MTKTTIEWADEVWNPVTGCTKVSEGCRHCYAERLAGRFWGERKFTEVRVHADRLNEPLHWMKPRRVFVNSMSDLFHPMVPDEIISAVYRTMRKADAHTFMVLTKRPDRMWEFINRYPGTRDDFAPNVWLGVSAETQKEADARIPILLQTPAAVRFVSVEPMLGKINLINYLLPYGYNWDYERRGPARINWVICGGESGPGARPMHPDWVRGLRDQGIDASVPFFFKQWGEWHPEFENPFNYVCAACGCAEDDPCEGGCSWEESDVMRDICSRCTGYAAHLWDDNTYSFRVGKKTAGRMLDGRTWEEWPR